MTLKTIHAPHLGRSVKMGRRPPVAHGPRLHLGNYLNLSTLPTPPASGDYSPAAMSALSLVMMNDTLGCCVISSKGHIVATETGNAGSLFTYSDAQIVKEYSAIGGYVPGDSSTDGGCDMVTALNWYVANGFADGTKLDAWVALDGANADQLRAAMWLFEDLEFGMALPDLWVNPFPSGAGFTWDVAGAPDPNNGHCVPGVGWTDQGIYIDTWGLIGTLTYGAIATYAVNKNGGELYALLTPDQIAAGALKAPNGFDWQSLVSDIQTLGWSGPTPQPPAPAPAPGPQPVPQPVPPAAIMLGIDDVVALIKNNWPS
jgi:hypothetical protein